MLPWRISGCVSWRSVVPKALLGKLKLAFIPMTKRSVHRDKPAASFKMLITLIFFNYKQKVFLCFRILSLNGSFENEHLTTKSLHTQGSHGWRGSVTTYQRLCLGGLPAGPHTLHRGPCRYCLPIPWESKSHCCVSH